MIKISTHFWMFFVIVFMQNIIFALQQAPLIPPHKTIASPPPAYAPVTPQATAPPPPSSVVNSLPYTPAPTTPQFPAPAKFSIPVTPTPPENPVFSSPVQSYTKPAAPPPAYTSVIPQIKAPATVPPASYKTPAQFPAPLPSLQKPVLGSLPLATQQTAPPVVKPTTVLPAHTKPPAIKGISDIKILIKNEIEIISARKAFLKAKLEELDDTLQKARERASESRKQSFEILRQEKEEGGKNIYEQVCKNFEKIKEKQVLIQSVFTQEFNKALADLNSHMGALEAHVKHYEAEKQKELQQQALSKTVVAATPSLPAPPSSSKMSTVLPTSSEFPQTTAPPALPQASATASLIPTASPPPQILNQSEVKKKKITEKTSTTFLGNVSDWLSDTVVQIISWIRDIKKWLLKSKPPADVKKTILSPEQKLFQPMVVSMTNMGMTVTGAAIALQSKIIPVQMVNFSALKMAQGAVLPKAPKTTLEIQAINSVFDSLIKQFNAAQIIFVEKYQQIKQSYKILKQKLQSYPEIECDTHSKTLKQWKKVVVMIFSKFVDMSFFVVQYSISFVQKAYSSFLAPLVDKFSKDVEKKLEESGKK
jgi:hypothetical protein